MIRDEITRIERTATRLTPDDIRRLAADYRHWRPVLSGALDSVPRRCIRAVAPMNDRLRETIVAGAGRGVGPIDLEDALMAAWLALLAATDTEQRPIVALLAGPWRKVARIVDERHSRTQADRVTFSHTSG